MLGKQILAGVLATLAAASSPVLTQLDGGFSGLPKNHKFPRRKLRGGRAGDKLARMAAKGRIGVGHPR